MFRSGDWASFSYNSVAVCEDRILTQWLPCQAETYALREDEAKKKYYRAATDVQFLLKEVGDVLRNISHPVKQAAKEQVKADRLEGLLLKSQT